MENCNEYSFFILANSSFPTDIKEGLAINFRSINENFFEISFYLEDRVYVLIASKYLNSNDSKELVWVLDYLQLVKRDNLKDIKLAEMFFQILSISNNYENEKQQICELIINHNNSKKSGMSQVYEYIYKYGIKSFEEDIFKNFESYSEIIIHLLLYISTEQTLYFNNIREIILNKWKEKEGKLYFYQKNKDRDRTVNEIILKSSEDNKDCSYYIQKTYIYSKIKKNFPIFLSSLNENFFEILFYDEMLEKHKVVVGKYPSNYELDTFIFIKTSLELIEQDNIENIQLVKLFFKTLNISNDYKEEKRQLNNFIVNHKISKETGMLDIYLYINKFGIKEFEKKLLAKFEFYDDEIINILVSLNSIPALVNISKSILKYRNEQIEKWDSLYIKPLASPNQKSISKKIKKNKSNFKKKKVNLNSKKNQEQQSVFKKKKDKSNLRPNRNGWKGIKINQPKKLTFVKKENN